MLFYLIKISDCVAVASDVSVPEVGVDDLLYCGNGLRNAFLMYFTNSLGMYTF